MGAGGDCFKRSVVLLFFAGREHGGAHMGDGRWEMYNEITFWVAFGAGG